MALEVYWTQEALDLLDEIIDYLQNHWTDREISAFFQRLEKAIEELRNSPSRYKRSARKPGAYEYQLAPQATLFYSFDDKRLNVLLIWPNKKNPENLR